MFRDVPECSGMFRKVPCSGFYRRPENPCLQQSPKKAVPSINKQSGVSHTIVNDNFPSLRRHILS